MSRRRQRVRGIAMFVTLPAALLGTATMAGAYGVAVMSRPTTVQCAPQVVAAPGRGSFDVRVFNASGINGVAGDITKQLTKRGFTIKETSTISALASSGPATIQHGSAGLDQALLLAQQVPGSKLRNDGRQGTGVALIIGDHFGGLVAVPPPIPPRPEKIQVDVYNTTFRSGLAGDAGEQLSQRKFNIGRTGNDPQLSFLPDDVAVIRYGEDGFDAAKVLAQHVPGARLAKVDRAGAKLDLVLGNHYQALTPAEQVPPPPVEPPKPKETVERPC